MNFSTSSIRSFRDLEVYQLAFELQQDVFVISKSWPREETYALTDQVRRSTRSIGANIAESWAKRRYPAHFVAKLTDADGELQETEHWLKTGGACDYVAKDVLLRWQNRSEEIGRRLGSMIARPEKFLLRM